MPVAESVGSAPLDVAAVDLGSNGFHMIIVRVENGSVHIVDRLREQVQLAAGLEADGSLSREAMIRGVACVERFGQRLRGIPVGQVGAVGTNTLRKARNGDKFLSRAMRALGHPIQIIAGREEARLIYLGVAHSEADHSDKRLVVDIGGGSTEFIIGQRFETLRRESLYMGCVSASRRHFRDGAITEQAMRSAELEAHLELDRIQYAYRGLGWDDCVGSSGTIKAVGAVLEANGWGDADITRMGLQKLRRALLKAGSISALKLAGLPEGRGPVFPGGVAVLMASFEALGIGRMRVSSGALREGLLYDLLGRLHHEDVRERTIATIAHRYSVDTRFAERVASTAGAALQQVCRHWGLPGTEVANLLRWAALLHEVGLLVAHNQYHKHGAYIVGNADMRGYTRQDQQLLAFLIRAHRRKFPQAELKLLPKRQRPVARYLAVLLRLAVLLHHNRVDEQLPAIGLTAHDMGLEVVLPVDWLDEHPLTRANLQREADYLAAVKFELWFE